MDLQQGFVLTRHWRDTPTGTHVEFWLATDAGPRQVRLPVQTSVAFPERISWYAVDFSLGTYGVEFDFITIEPNGIKQVHLKASCSLAEEEPFANYVVGGFMFTEACKLVIAELLEQPQQPTPPEAVKPKKPKKTLFEFIHNIKDKEAFTSELKDLFPTEIGKSIKAIIDILSKEQFLIYGTKEFKQLFEELKNCFSRDIGSYNSVQNVKTVDAETTDIILKKLNPLIIKYKAT